MADSQLPDLTASNKDDAAGDARAAALAGYLEWLDGRPLAIRSREAYGHQVRRFVLWLGDRWPVDGDPLADAAARDWAVRDYKRHLKAVERWKPASLNLALASLDSFYTYLGLGRPVVRPEELPGEGAARALGGAAAAAVTDCGAGVGPGPSDRRDAALHGPTFGGARRARRG